MKICESSATNCSCCCDNDTLISTINGKSIYSACANLTCRVLMPVLTSITTYIEGQNCSLTDCGSICWNSTSSCEVTCMIGYQESTDNSTCTGYNFNLLSDRLIISIGFPFNPIDINECMSSNGGCSQICTNTNGSYICSCQTGYMPINDNRTCIG